MADKELEIKITTKGADQATAEIAKVENELKGLASQPGGDCLSRRGATSQLPISPRKSWYSIPAITPGLCAR